MGTRFRWGVFDLVRAADGKQVFIGITSNRHWETFCREFGQSELGAHPNLQSNEARTRARDWLIPRVQEIAGGYESNDLMDKLEKAEVPYAPVNSPADLYEDPYLMGDENRLLPVDAGQKTERLPALQLEIEGIPFSLSRRQPRR